MCVSLLCLKKPVSVKPLNASALGFSLLEVMMIMALMSLTIMPLAVSINQLGAQSRGSYVASSRNLQVNSLIDSIDAARPDFTTQFTNGAMVTTQSESGQTLPYWRKVDVTNAGNSNSLKRTIALYTYNNASDASSSPRDKLEVVDNIDSLRLRFGNVAPIIDSSGNYWYGDGGATPLSYSTSDKVPGAEGSYAIPGYSTDIVNTSGNDDEIYKYGRYVYNGDVFVSADVPEGWYIVKIYMAEHDPAQTINTRLQNFSLQGVRMTPRPYSVLRATGGVDRANVQMFETYVDNSQKLELQIRFDQNATNINSYLRSISIMKKKG